MRQAGILVAATLLSGASPPGGQAPPRFATRVDAVYVDAFVARHGAPVAGLTARDFEIEDEGVRQEAEIVALESVPLAVVLVFDTSRSVQGAKLLALREAGGAFLDASAPGSRIALVGFNHDVVLLAPLGSDRDTVRRGLDSMRAEGSSAVLDALFAGLGLAGHARALVLLFSDGEDNVSWLSADDVRASTERSNAVVHVVGFVPAPRARADVRDPALKESEQPRHVRELRQIAEATGGRFWGAESLAQIREAFAAVAAEVNARYVLRFEPKGAGRPGWHRLEVRLKDRKGTVRSRRGYYVPVAGPPDAAR